VCAQPLTCNFIARRSNVLVVTRAVSASTWGAGSVIYAMSVAVTTGLAPVTVDTSGFPGQIGTSFPFNVTVGTPGVGLVLAGASGGDLARAVYSPRRPDTSSTMECTAQRVVMGSTATCRVYPRVTGVGIAARPNRLSLSVTESVVTRTDGSTGPGTVLSLTSIKAPEPSSSALHPFFLLFFVSTVSPGRANVTLLVRVLRARALAMVAYARACLGQGGRHARERGLDDVHRVRRARRNVDHRLRELGRWLGCRPHHASAAGRDVHHLAEAARLSRIGTGHVLLAFRSVRAPRPRVRRRPALTGRAVLRAGRVCSRPW
jgi:hypothetical protein